MACLKATLRFLGRTEGKYGKLQLADGSLADTERECLVKTN